MVGLSVDLGPNVHRKKRLQAFTDASALAAVRQMDGPHGLQLAHNTATLARWEAQAERWMFDTNPRFPNKRTLRASLTVATTTMARSSAGANNYRFIKGRPGNGPLYSCR